MREHRETPARPPWWGARDHRTATRVVAVMTVFGALYAVGISLWAPASLGNRGDAFTLNLVTASLMVLLGAPAAIAPHRMPSPAPFLLALVAGGTVGWLDLVTEDTSFGGQIYLAWPAFFGAYFLRPRAAWFVAAQAVASVATVPWAVGETATYFSDLPAFVLTVGGITAALTVSRDRAEQLLDRLRSEAEEDPLTRLATRRVFDARLSATLEEGLPCTLLLADVDEFKSVNDRAGHHTGDLVLSSVAAELDAVCRTVDVVARLGGDELAVLLLGPDAGDAVGGRVVAERFRAAVAALRVPADDGTTLSPTVSVGVATTLGRRTGRDPETPRDLLIRADQALYEAKRSGRNRVVVRHAPARSSSPAPAPRRGRTEQEQTAQ